MPPGLPKPPWEKLSYNPLDGLREIIHDGRKIIKDAGSDIRSLAGEIKSNSHISTATVPDTEETSLPETQASVQTTTVGVSDKETLKYQLDLILDDLHHLETEHLPAQGRIAGVPCDCIAKAGRSLRRHAKETIPIAARQGEEPELFSELASWAQQLMDIGTLDKVQTGEYDAEYLKASGVASNLRKKIEPMFTSLGGDGECDTCAQARESIKRFVEERKREKPKA